MPDDIRENNNFVSHPLIRNSSVEFRLYQSNISKSAISKNTLVILPTALGKTIISLLVCVDTLYNYRDKRVLIMAPTRPLVTQHMKSFSSSLKLMSEQTAAVTGKIIPYSRRIIWDKSDIRLVFATPEVVKNDIEEGRLSLTDFMLLIFDEAHRAVKDYAYTFIAKEYMKQSIYPLILALTASPGSDKQRMQEICDNLFIEHLEYRNEEDQDVRQYINPVEIEWKFFDLPPEYQYIRSNLRSMLDEKIKWLIQHKLLLRKNARWIFKRDLINVGEQIRNNLEITSEQERRPLYIALMQQSLALSLMYCSELIESQGSYSLKAFLDRIEDVGEVGRKSHQSLVKDTRIKEIQTLVNKLAIDHPKLRYIVNILKNKHHDTSSSCHSAKVEKYNQFNHQEKLDHQLKHPHHTNHAVLHNLQTNSNVLIFTQYRDTARRIVQVLLENGIKASRFVGQAKRRGDVGMKQDEQTSVLDSFRNGEFNILVATSIAEEGLDIPEVDLVIFYEPIPSDIRYIQRKGRTGRKSAGSVVILAAKDTIDERYLQGSKKRVEKMNQTLSSLSMSLKSIDRNPLSTDPMTLDDLSLIEATESINQKSKVEKTKAFMIGKNTDSSCVTTPNDISLQGKMNSSLSLATDTLTTNFRQQVDKAARRINSLLVSTGNTELNFNDICEYINATNNSVVIEALNKLEKLRRIEWIDDSTIALIKDSISGKTYDVYVEKIMEGRAVVMVNGKWRARLYHYDYEGSRSLLKKGKEFRALGELYRNDGILNLRVKQIV
jgi:ERCC4-related helicase